MTYLTSYSNNSRKSVTLVVEGKKIAANKSVLASKSKYFDAIFARDWLETIENQITIQTKFEAFIFVLMLASDVAISQKTWILKSITDIIESLIIADRFMFNKQIMSILSKQYFKKLQLENRPSDLKCRETAFHNLSLICETYKLANYYNLDQLALLCEKYFDEHPTDSLLYFEKHDYPIVLLEKIFKRSTFGVQEISIFNLVQKLVLKFGLKAVKPLFNTIRLNLMNIEEISSIIRSGIFDGKTKYSLSEITDTTCESKPRTSYEVDNKFKSDCVCLLNSRIETLRHPFYYIICTTIDLPIETRINYLGLHIRQRSLSDSSINLERIQYVRIELFSRDKTKTSFDLHLIPKLESLINLKPKLVSKVSIHCNNRLMVESITYGFTRAAHQLKFAIKV